MKKLNIENKYDLRFLLIYGILINLICFMSLSNLENLFLNRTFICTPLVYFMLMSLIITKLHDSSLKIFFRSLIYMIFATLALTVAYFLSWKLNSEFWSYSLVAIIYLFFISLILISLPFIKLNVMFFIRQFIIFSISTLLIFILLTNSQGYYYGLQLLLSVWVLLLSIDLVLVKIIDNTHISTQLK